MKTETISKRLRSKDINTQKKALKYLAKRKSDSSFLSNFHEELTEISHIAINGESLLASELLIFNERTKWFESFYSINENFYIEVEQVIDEIIKTKVDNATKKKDYTYLRSKIKLFLKRLGQDEKYTGVTLAEYVRYSTKKKLRKSECLGDNYKLILRKLSKFEIIEIDPSYSDSKGISKGYRIHRKWLKSNNNSNSFIYNEILIAEKTKEIFKHIDLDYTWAKRRFNQYLKNELINDKIWISNIDPLLDNGKLHRVFLFIEKANGKIELKERYNVEQEHLGPYKILFIHDKKLIASSADKYEYWKKRNVSNSYIHSISKFLIPETNDRLTTDGRRLYTSLTNLPKLFIPYLKIDGSKFVEIDLNNAQWRILLHCIENPKLNNIISLYVRNFGNEFTQKRDFINMAENIKNGKFYEYIREHLMDDVLIEELLHGQSFNHLNEIKYNKLLRRATKSLTFLILFSSNSYQPKIKGIFAKKFPTIAWLCEQIKDPEIYNQLFPEWIANNEDYFERFYSGEKPMDKNIFKEFSKELQRVEGNIFINQILSRLLDNNIKALSKHDAILIPEHQLEDSNVIIQDELDSIFGKNTYKLSYTYV